VNTVKAITKLQNQIQKNEEKLPKYMMSLKAAETALTKRNNKIKNLKREPEI
jgi:hypothetical protein